MYRELSNMFENHNKLADALEKAIKTIAKKESAGAEITEIFVKTAFEQYRTESEAFKQQIGRIVESASAYLT